MNSKKVPEKAVHKSKYLAAFSFTTLIFVLGILLGNHFSAVKIDQITDLQGELNVKVAGTELRNMLLVEHPCESFDSTLTEELFDVGTKLDYMESQLGKQNKKVLSLKERYSLLEIRHWLLLKKAKKQCDLDLDLVLYFYSNLGDCHDCEQQGYVLSTLHKKYPKLNIYSFDINIDNPALNTVKRIFKIDSAPALVVNEELLEGVRSKNVLEEKLFVNETSSTNKTTIAS